MPTLMLYLVLVMLHCEAPGEVMPITVHEVNTLVGHDQAQVKEEALRLIIGKEPTGYTGHLQAIQASEVPLGDLRRVVKSHDDTRSSR
jgi:hypothetical protein